jgi:hypothetical protein
MLSHASFEYLEAELARLVAVLTNALRHSSSPVIAKRISARIFSICGLIAVEIKLVKGGQ